MLLIYSSLQFCVATSLIRLFRPSVYRIWWNLSGVGDGTGNLGKCAIYVYLRAATTPGASVMFYWYHVDDAHETCGPLDEDLDPGCEDYFVPGTACASVVPFAAPRC